jgi:hypothetical protein
MKTRIKKVVNFKETWYYPQHKFLWWWVYFLKGEIGETLAQAIRFEYKTDCENFLDERNYSDKVTYIKYP